jgi:tetratricopeptide (TPR) repeat protein
MYLSPAIKAANPKTSDILTQILGGTTELVAEKAYREADVYYHAGMVGYRPCRHNGCENHEHHDSLDVQDHDEHFRSDYLQQKKFTLPLANVVDYLHGQTAPRVHRHLQGSEEKEVLPWFVVAVRLNPHLIDAYSDGCYWFYRCGDVQMAERFITEGIRHNPKNYRLYLDRGILYHRLRRWKAAISDFEKALDLWQNNSEDAPYDLRAIRTYLRHSKEQLKPSPSTISPSQARQKAAVEAELKAH